MALYNPIYVTAAEVKENTTIATLAVETDALVNKLIVKAQVILDWYIGDVEPYSDTQDFKFPNVDNETPTNVKQATIYIVESIYSELKQARNWIKSEAWDGYSVSYVDQVPSTKFEYVTMAAKDLLAEYGLWNNWKAAFKLNY